MPIQKTNATQTSQSSSSSSAPAPITGAATARIGGGGSPSPAATPTADASAVREDRDEPASSGAFNLLSGLGEAFGGLAKKAEGAFTPLDFDQEEREAGQEAADTLGRLAGPDGTWDKEDLGRNFAQLQFPGGLKGIAARGVAAGRLLKSHGVENTPEKRNELIGQGREIAGQNPDIARLHKLESIDPARLNDDQRKQYDEAVTGLREKLGPQGLLPVGLDQLQDFGDSADLLKEKLGERGLTPPEGKPVDVEQFRSLYEGKPPAATLLKESWSGEAASP